MLSTNLKNKKILITAGPTWVPIDNVRIISNLATGETGILLAKEAKRLGAKVTLLQGPIAFAELRDKIKRELRFKKYDVIIHSAAVSDFRLLRKIKGKLDSGRAYNLSLAPLPKISRDIKRLSRQAKLVIFKLEPGLSDKNLIRKAMLLQFKAEAQIVVANRLNPYRAFIINQNAKAIPVRTKQELVKKLLKII